MSRTIQTCTAGGKMLPFHLTTGVIRKSGPSIGGVKKPHRSSCPGWVALREIKRYQKYAKLLIRKYQRSDRGIKKNSKSYLRFRLNAIELYQKACENYLIELLENASLCTIHARCAIIALKEIQFDRRGIRRQRT